MDRLPNTNWASGFPIPPPYPSTRNFYPETTLGLPAPTFADLDDGYLCPTNLSYDLYTSASSPSITGRLINETTDLCGALTENSTHSRGNRHGVSNCTLGVPISRTSDDEKVCNDHDVNLNVHPLDAEWMIDTLVSDQATARSTETLPSGEANQTAAMECKWEGCKYNGHFARTVDLERHVKSVHISPGSYQCPAEGCCKFFNRKDNCNAHFNRRHKTLELQVEQGKKTD
ncbi:hypothetical protein BGW36DRAFT_374239 [Talaromyces proteolyticus]|uniref:C2H2-type domain-containing protein n=1 Tax=Talaromyces proteolyticus TaxID=1131652 RepID=A0AAD4KZ41_9EURO|nr:uncharacterized protein BGW36DRAFT_374239 [Talaromyces proteolyticus]KAH8700485.1 hypothetical protein BGW36DRAFT_374239 [Talaromyces proteolyticus]